MKSTLHPHQQSAIDDLYQSVGASLSKKQPPRPMLQAPTAFGKTVLAAALVERARKKGKRVAFCVPRTELIDQTVTAFYEEGIDAVGVIQADHHMTDWSQPIQVCSAQTLGRRKQFPTANVIVIDEAHQREKTYEEWMAMPGMERVPFIGMSATPWTRGLGKIYDDLIIAATTKDLIEKGYLSKYRVFAPGGPDLSGVKTDAKGDYQQKDLAKNIAPQSALTADVVQTWIDRAEQRPTLCFAIDVAHANALQERFAQAGVTAAVVTGKTPRNERDIIRMKFHAGLIKVVCNCQVLTTGVDWDVRCISLARPTKSEMLFVQMIGRGLRTADGKDHCLILDHSDSHLRLGFVADIHHEHLDGGKLGRLPEQKAKEKLPRACPQCKFVAPWKEGKCPECGYELPKRKTNVREGNGALIEFNGEKLKGKQRINKITTPEEKRRFYGELLGYAIERGFSPGWASHKYRDKFGVWPNGYSDAPPTAPSVETLRYIKSRNIAWAHRRAQ